MYRTSMRTIGRPAIALCVLLALATIACTENGEPEGEALEEPSETPTEEPSETPTEEPSESPPSPGLEGGVGAGEANCTNIKKYKVLGLKHVAEGITPDYNSTPPTSGPHYSTTAEAGFYEQGVPEQALVHNLEHGQIVVWYRPDAPREVIDALMAEMEPHDPLATVVAPYEKIKSPYNFAITAWGAAQSCELVSKKVFDKFRRRYQGKGPEDVGVTPFSD